MIQDDIWQKASIGIRALIALDILLYIHLLPFGFNSCYFQPLLNLEPNQLIPKIVHDWSSVGPDTKHQI